MSPGSLFCYVIKGEQLQKSVNLSASRGGGLRQPSVWNQQGCGLGDFSRAASVLEFTVGLYFDFIVWITASNVIQLVEACSQKVPF